MISVLASAFGKNKTITYSIPILNKLKTDQCYSVRVAILSNLEPICEVINISTKLLIFPIWEYLVNDEIWNVRKACVNSIVTLSQFMKNKDRMELVYYFCKLIDDNVRWVKLAAYLIVGKFITTFSKDSIVEILIYYFKNLSISCANDKHYLINNQVSKENDHFYDCDMITKCAFDFPAVLIALGKNGWTNLRETFIILTQDVNVQTRHSIASSLHIIATVIGAEEIEKTLFPVIHEYTTDDNFVKLELFSNIANILRLTTNEIRDRNMWLINYVCEIKKNDLFWRFRETIASQLGEITTLYSLDIITNKLIPTIKLLLTDPVATVRRAMYKQIGFVITSLLHNEKEKRLFCDYLLSLATKHYQHKIIFSKMCPIIFDISNEEFITYFLPSLLNLANINESHTTVVRIQAIKTLLRINTKVKNIQITEILHHLHKNKDSEMISLLKDQTHLK